MCVCVCWREADAISKRMDVEVRAVWVESGWWAGFGRGGGVRGWGHWTRTVDLELAVCPEVEAECSERVS